MADKLGARQDSSFKAISTAPDICKTPVGNTVVPIPYPIVSDLSQSIQTVPKVRFNGKPCYVLDQSIIPTCMGDEPGTAMGVRSGTNKGKTEPTSGSSSVRAGKKKVVRERDTCTMNNGNTNGIFVTQPGVGCKCSKGKPTKDTNPPPKDETKKEKTFKEKLGEWWDNTKKEVKEAVKHPVEGAKGAAKGTANIVPELGEVFTKSSMLDTANQMDQAAGFQELFGNAEKAKEYSDAATSMRSSVDSVNLPKFDMSNAAQAGGDKIFTVVTLVTGLYGLAKNATKIGVKGTAKLGAKAESTAVKETAAIAKEEKAMADATKEIKAAEKAASKGDGVKIKGKTTKVIKDDSIIDPNLKDARGRTNKERMEKGLAPIGPDGKPVNLHHVDQTADGPIAELTATNHQQNYATLHSNTGSSPSNIDRSSFDAWRSEYWKVRANDFK